jgi:hypothetical protein
MRNIAIADLPGFKNLEGLTRKLKTGTFSLYPVFIAAFMDY